MEQNAERDTGIAWKEDPVVTTGIALDLGWTPTSALECLHQYIATAEKLYTAAKAALYLPPSSMRDEIAATAIEQHEKSRRDLLNRMPLQTSWDQGE